ncbi:MAG: hypothetical protein FWD13_08530 [Treponema sp.]|nr:hypothetical protein [Treponema sp.]
MKFRFLNGKICVLFFLFMAIPGYIFSQAVSPAVEFENLLNTEVVTYAQAARFVLQAAEVSGVNTPQEAFLYAVSQGWLPRNTREAEEARLDNIALLLSGSFDVRGSLLYSITKNSRYAYRQLRYMNIIQGRVVSSMPVSGERLVFYVNMLLDLQYSFQQRQGN